MPLRPALYLLPGLLCDSALWAHQSAALDRDYRIGIPDLTTFDSLETMAQAVLKAAPERFSLAGHSMGGRVALEMFRLAPERIERLALLDTGTHPPGEVETQEHRRLVELAEREGMDALAEYWLPQVLHPVSASDSVLLDILRAMVQRMSPDVLRRHVAALLARPDAGVLLAHIRCATLIGVGCGDRWSPPTQHEPVAAAVPQARYAVFEDGGHLAPAEAPEAVTQALREWMRQPTVD